MFPEKDLQKVPTGRWAKRLHAWARLYSIEAFEAIEAKAENYDKLAKAVRANEDHMPPDVLAALDEFEEAMR